MGQKLRGLLKERISEEKGMALLLTLILVALGSLIITPLLGFMATGLNTTYNLYDPKADELYAADTGVREALWRISNQDVYPLPSEEITTTVNSIPLEENGKDISVQISTYTTDELLSYKITSVATDPVNGQHTSIDALVYSVNMTSFIDKIITSPSEIKISPQTTITGNGHPMWVPDGWSGNNVLLIDTPVETNPITSWPTAISLIEYYSDDVDKTYPPPSYIAANGVIEVSEDMSIGPFYYEGDVAIKKSHGSGVPEGDLRVNLEGLVYIKGTLSITKDITLDLYGGPSPSLNPTAILVSLEDLPEGMSVITVNSTANFPSEGILLVRGTNPEYLPYNYIDTSNNTIYLEKPTSKVHANNDPVEAILQVPNTIFIEGEPDTWNFTSTTDCTINGPGAIIAVGNIRFQPKVDADSGFIYLMSLGTMDFQPQTGSGEPSGFTGSVVARDFNPMGRSDYSYPPEGYPLNMDIPMGDKPTIIGGIAYWKIY